MKASALFFSLLWLAAFTFSSCNPEDDGIVGTEVGSGEVTATVDGQNFQSKSSMDGAVYTENSGLITIQAWTDDNQYISVSIFNPSSATGQKFEVTSGEVNAQYHPVFNGGETFAASGGLGSGEAEFSTLNDNRAKGTFSFTGTKINMDGSQEDISITNGSFDFNL